MLCSRPIRLTKADKTGFLGIVGCGKCHCCRVNIRRTWTGRMLLEATAHEAVSFATLTYSDENLPWKCIQGMPQMDLEPNDLRLWMMRFRKAFGSFRYFAVGEYGDKSHRPHYHAILFGVPATATELLEETWGNGYVSLTEANDARMAYCAHYTTKKWTTKKAPELSGRTPEFARMSLKPPIGSLGLERVLETYHTREGSRAVAEGRLSRTFRKDGRVYPLGRTMTARMREALGLPRNYEFGGDIRRLPGSAEEAQKQWEKGQAREARLKALSGATRRTTNPV